MGCKSYNWTVLFVEYEDSEEEFADHAVVALE